MIREEKIQLLKDIHAGRKKISEIPFDERPYTYKEVQEIIDLLRSFPKQANGALREQDKEKLKSLLATIAETKSELWKLKYQKILD